MNRNEYAVQLYGILLDKFRAEGVPNADWAVARVGLQKKTGGYTPIHTVISYRGKCLNKMPVEEMIAAIKLVVPRVPATRFVIKDDFTLWDVLAHNPTKSYESCKKAMQKAGLVDADGYRIVDGIPVYKEW